ncbi:MAG TPA: hypothetical protein VMG12_19230 [Polyangiaceae bacterium]|nr:hypothetical protein [Polyangiaceae bacterium]
MAWHFRLHSTSRASFAVAFFGLCLSGLPLGCGSDADADNDETPSERVEVPSRSEPAPRDERPAAASAPEPEASAADDEPAPAETGDTPPAAGGDDPPAAPGASAGGDQSVAPAAASAFASCARRDGPYGTDCDYVYLTMTQASPPRCVQLTVDNCDAGGYGNSGLSVDTPISWQLSSATITDSPGDCALGVYYPESIIVVDASGTIDLEGAASTSLPTSITVDIALTPSSSADDPTPVEVQTSAPVAAARCEED